MARFRRISPRRGLNSGLRYLTESNQILVTIIDDDFVEIRIKVIQSAKNDEVLTNLAPQRTEQEMTKPRITYVQ